MNLKISTQKCQSSLIEILSDFLMRQQDAKYKYKDIQGDMTDSVWLTFSFIE